MTTTIDRELTTHGGGNMGLAEKRLRLSRGEGEALMHRLAVPDALVEALSDDDGPPRWHPQDIEYVIERIASGNMDDAFAHSEAITRAVLVDCVEGSTWVGACDRDDARRQAIAYRQLCGLAKKLEALLGLEKSIDVPNF